MLTKKLQTNFTIADNRIAQDKTLSYEARGLYFYMLSLPSDWDFSEQRLANQGCVGIDKIKRILKELFSVGLLSREFSNNDKGHRKYIYTLYDYDTKVNPTLENPTLENPITYKENNINKENNKQNRDFEKKVSNETYFSQSLVRNEISHDCESENKADSNPPLKPSENQATSKKGRQGDMTLFESLPKGKGYTEEFETFWAMYRKYNAKSKAKAFEAYGKALKKGANHTQLLESLKKQTEIWDIEKRLSNYTPHCSTWLNGGAYNDDFEAIKQQAISSQQSQQRPQSGYYAKEKRYSEDGYELDEKGHRINPDPTNNFFCPHGFYDNREEYVEFINLFPEGRNILDPEVEKADRIIEQNWLKEKARRREEKKRLSGN